VEFRYIKEAELEMFNKEFLIKQDFTKEEDDEPPGQVRNSKKSRNVPRFPLHLVAGCRGDFLSLNGKRFVVMPSIIRLSLGKL